MSDFQIITTIVIVYVRVVPHCFYSARATEFVDNNEDNAVRGMVEKGLRHIVLVAARRGVAYNLSVYSMDRAC